jgi:hypothetical protein
MNNKLPILIAATIGLSILTTNISVNSAIARNTYESGYGGMGYRGYGGMGHGGVGPVIQEPVDTGNHHLESDKQILQLSIAHTRGPTNYRKSR